MKKSEKGYSLIELLVAVTIMVLAATGAGSAVYQILKNIENNNDRMTVVRQVENAGYWISRDAQMARALSTSDNLTDPDFLSLSWTSWDDAGLIVDHSANYTFVNVTDKIGDLKRTYTNGVTTQTTIVAQYIFFDLADTSSTSNTTFNAPLLTVRLTAKYDQVEESREYSIQRRPGF